MNNYMKTKCLYCENIIENEDDTHFQSCCCGRGMCDDCYGSLQGTEEQWQIDSMDDENYQKYVENKKYPFGGDYLCFNCVE